MMLGRDEVQAWLDEVSPGTGSVRLATLADLPRLRVKQQLARGNVAPATIAAISRGLDLDPLAELTRFEVFADLVPSSPAPEEMPGFISSPGLLRTSADRLENRPVAEVHLGSERYELAALYWFNLASDGALRARLADELGVNQPTLWKMLRTRLREDVALTVCEHAGWPGVSALVVSEVLTGAEAGWVEECRATWANTVPVGDLLSCAEQRLQQVGKQERDRESFDRHLG
ncbi:hypothetical protein [Glutamicibacter arilaitensis]|uniref:hypothetical protein n=1 Tax=Glutamicibacter arilaitensis TaxID=256701 RepID=UPI003FD337EC